MRVSSLSRFIRFSRVSRFSRALLSGVALVPFAVVACASVLGIDDPLPLRDAAADGLAADGRTQEADSDIPLEDTGSAGNPEAGDAADDGPNGDASDAGMAVDAGSDTGSTFSCNGSCVGAPPQGWDGPFAFSLTTGSAAPPSCAAPYGSTVFDYKQNLNAPNATCGCTCGAPSNVACVPPTITFFTDNACGMPCGAADQPIGTGCTAYDESGCTKSPKGASLTAGVADGGTCPPQPTMNIPASSWGAVVRLCSVTAPGSGTCPANDVCAPAPKVPQTTDAICLAHTDDVMCPAGYPKRQIVYSSVMDGRGCTPCTCGAPAGATCTTPAVTGYDGTACAMGNHPLAPGACVGMPGLGAKAAASATPSGGSCTPSTVMPSGAATPADATTLCCTN